MRNLLRITKSNLILLAILGLALGYLALHGYFSNRELTATVEITDDGFKPETLNVLAGTTVTWVNTGERAHWPASNFHPLHNLYPEVGGCIGSAFDACRGLANGETFSFKLDRVGTWPVHDHLFPGFNMIVEVTEDGSEAIKTSLDLKSMTPEILRSSDYAAQMSFVKEFAEADPASAWEFLKKTFIVGGSVVGNAHEFSHIIGNTLYKKEGLKGIKDCDTSFAFGCMHGVTEAMLIKEGVEKIKSIEEQCLKFFPPDKNIDYTGCVHGVGHGLYTFAGANLKEALNNCDILSEAYRNYCYDGVFMENSTNPEGGILDPKNPWKLCSGVNEKYHRVCAKYQSQIFINSPGGNLIEEVGKNCSLGPTKLLKEMCFESLGYYVSQRNLGDVKKITENCNQIIEKEGKELCYVGGAIETVFQRYNNWKDTYNKICSGLLILDKDSCFARIKFIIDMYDVQD